jgi:hypothetical protein
MRFVRQQRDPASRNSFVLRRRHYLQYSLCLIVTLLFVGLVSTAHVPITTKVRFNREVVRIFQRNCLACHRPEGIAPMSLATYEEARPWAKAIKEELLEKRMPPWHAVRGYGDFRNAPQLTQHELDLIVNWVEGGAPKGDDKDLPDDLFPEDWVLGKPDMVLKPSVKTEVASDADEQKTFVIATKLKRDRWLTAVDLKPEKRSVVHCATILLDSGQNSGEKESFKGSKNHPQLPFVLANWAPDQRALVLPNGIAQLVPAGSRIVLRVHYRGSGETAKDLSSVGLYFAKSPPQKLVRQLVVEPAPERIPAGVSAHRIVATTIVEEDGELVALRPQVNPMIVSLQATAHLPDGVQDILIWTRGFSFDVQTIYQVKEPVRLPKGTRIEVIAYLDNSEDNKHNVSDPPRELQWPDDSDRALCMLSIAMERESSPRASR